MEKPVLVQTGLAKIVFAAEIVFTGKNRFLPALSSKCAFTPFLRCFELFFLFFLMPSGL